MERKKVDWGHHIQEFERSGQKATDYCRAAGLNLGSFRSNLYKHRARNKPSPKFHEIFVNTELSLSLGTDGQLAIGGIEPDILPDLVKAWSSAVSQ